MRTYDVLFLGIVARLAGLFLVSRTGPYALNIVLSLAWLLGIITAPFALWYDRKYVLQETRWKPNTAYIILSVVPVLGILTTAYYLNKRRKKLAAE